MIIILFLIGFLLGLVYSLIGEKLPMLLPEVGYHEDNDWILNLFIAILNSLVMLISYYNFSFSYEFWSSLVIAFLVTTIFISDFKYMIILDSPLIISGIIIFGLKWFYYGIKTALLSLGSGILLFIFMIIMAIIGKKLFKKDALGGGDIKLALIIGLVLNFRLGLLSIIFSSLLAMPYALGTMMLSKNKEVPFGPFLIGSMAIVFIFNDKFMNLISFLFS